MLSNGYEKNGLIFWTEAEIERREMFVRFFTGELRTCLMKANPAFQFERIEAPMLTPASFINPNYTDDDVFKVGDLVLRPETTMGSYVAAKEYLDGHFEHVRRLPLVVWQHGKSFRNEQDQPTKFMRLKEFYQLEYQILYSAKTANDYQPLIVTAVKDMISQMIGPCFVGESDRLPDYSTETVDVICDATSMEVCSISRRKDYSEAVKNVEVAIGTDRCLYNWALKAKSF